MVAGQQRLWLATTAACLPLMRLTAEQRQEFDRDGVVVVEGAVPLPLCAAAVRAVERFLGKGATDPSTGGWYTPPGLRYHGLVSNNSHQALWDTRQHENLHGIFADLLGTHRLRVSGDSTNFTPPATEAWGSQQHIHWDVDSSRHDSTDPHGLGVQGVLCLTDCAADQGGLVVVPGFHHQLQEWAASQPAQRNVEIPRLSDIASWVEEGPGLRYVAAAAGSIVIWNSALPHSNSRNTALLPRIAQYITFSVAPPEEAGSSANVNPAPLARGYFDVIADALGVRAASVVDWLHAHTQSDLLEVPCDIVEVMPMQDGKTAYWLRVRGLPGHGAGAPPVDLHSQWSSVQPDGDWAPVADDVVAVQYPYLERLSLPAATLAGLEIAQAGASAARRDRSISRVPEAALSDGRGSGSATVARLSVPQHERLSELLLSRAPWRSDGAEGEGAARRRGRVWTEETIAALIGREFGQALVVVVPAVLTPLGRKLLGVEPWPAAARVGGEAAAAAAASDARL